MRDGSVDETGLAVLSGTESAALGAIVPFGQYNAISTGLGSGISYEDTPDDDESARHRPSTHWLRVLDPMQAFLQKKSSAAR